MTELELLDLAREACDAAVRAGAEFAEARVGEVKSVAVRLERSSVDTSEVKRAMGARIKAFVRGGQGSVSVDGLDRDRLMHSARRAAEMAAFAKSDKDFVTLPEPKPYIPLPGMYDPLIERLGVKDIAGFLLDCVESAWSVAPDAVCTGGSRAGSGRSAVANSLGVACSSSATYLSAWIEPIIRKGDDVGAYYEYDAARQMSDFDHSGLGAKAAKTALRLLGARKIETGVMPVVLGPLAANGLIEALASQASAEGHQRGRSWLCGKLGRKIASEHLSLVDNPLIPAGLGSQSFDSEGVPGKVMTIIEDGVLVNLLHNSYTANKAKAPYTGHAAGDGISPTNVIPKLGSLTMDEIVRQTGRGLYIDMGRISPDSATGEVSAMVDFGFVIDNGEIAYPVSSAMIGISGCDLLNNLDAVSSDARIEPGSVMPSVRIQGVRVAGGA